MGAITACTPAPLRGRELDRDAAFRRPRGTVPPSVVVAVVRHFTSTAMLYLLRVVGQSLRERLVSPKNRSDRSSDLNRARPISTGQRTSLGRVLTLVPAPLRSGCPASCFKGYHPNPQPPNGIKAGCKCLTYPATACAFPPPIPRLEQNANRYVHLSCPRGGSSADGPLPLPLHQRTGVRVRRCR
jgi:hypothetical protein